MWYLIFVYIIFNSLYILCTYYIMRYYKRHAYCRLVIYELLLFRVTATYARWLMSMMLATRGIRHILFDIVYLTVLLTSRNHCGGKRAVNYIMEIKHNNIICFSIAAWYVLYIRIKKYSCSVIRKEKLYSH